MTKQDVNEQIALLLGFKKVGDKWIYPDEFHYMVAQVPEYYCPNFLEIIDRHAKICDLMKYGTPRNYTD